MLQVDKVTVTFGGIRALAGVDLNVEPGQVTGLIGPNGAGKTTLFNVITGLQRPQGGRVLLEGTDITAKGAKARARMGMGRTFQRLEVFGSLSALDNVLVAVENSGGFGRAARAKAHELLEKVGAGQVATTQADVLPTGLARLLEVARALACSPKLLLLDEPFSGLDGSESEHLGDLIEELVADGLAVLLVEHDMEMVMRLCANIYVLSFGSLIATGNPDQIKADPIVQEAYLGAPMATGAGA
ncbi:MAG TPA: ABC transporter ATP-binding protein [Acidimicrobiales bacterium]|jgi:branched-chain amino acid transport system ATP-binding protein|nr:ABC transporter ATP-binding protein [Acidimicrobiales bacterium]